MSHSHLMQISNLTPEQLNLFNEFYKKNLEWHCLMHSIYIDGLVGLLQKSKLLYLRIHKIKETFLNNWDLKLYANSGSDVHLMPMAEYKERFGE